MTEIRVENASTLDYSDVTVAGVPFDDVAAGATSGYRNVDLRFGLGVIELTADGRRVTGKTLSFGGRRYTHRIDVADLEAGHLSIDVIPEDEPGP